MIIIELFAAAVVIIVSGFGAWGVALRQRRRREQQRLSDPWQQARDRWITTGDEAALKDMLDHEKGS